MSHIFISHATADDPFVAQLRQQLEGHSLPTWVDSRQLRGGAKLAPEIEAAIQDATSFIVVLSPQTINSSWVRTEIKLALEVQRNNPDYGVIPVLLPGVEPTALGMWFDEEPLAVPIHSEVGGLGEAMPTLRAALGEQLPEDHQPSQAVSQLPTDKLTLVLDDVAILAEEGVRRPTAQAQLFFEPDDPQLRPTKSRRFAFTAPLGVIEMADLSWYLEEYYLWPTGVGTAEARKARIEAQLPRWGQALYDAAFSIAAAQSALQAWQRGEAATLQFSVEVAVPDKQDEAELSDEDLEVAREGASLLLALPWELLHDGQGYLFQGKRPLRVRRQIPSENVLARQPTSLPIRILLISPRPELDASGKQAVGYIDHRSSAGPLVAAVAELGALAQVHLLATPTLPGLNAELQRASEQGQPYHVVHFDGHGVYDKEVGLGALCFESAQDQESLGERRAELVHADELAQRLRDYGIPLIFLDACQTAQSQDQPTASVAARLLQGGTTSVVAMSHTVLVETASRFVTAFYGALTQGKSVGMAMLAGQRALMDNSWRGHLIGGGDLLLQDWFLPVLYQETLDPQLFTQLPSDQVRQLQAQQREMRLGNLPPAPDHHFVGRSRELLQLERLLAQQPYVTVRGSGGMGKTALAAEAGRWLVQTNRFGRVAFVSMEEYSYDLSILDSIGQQLLPGDKYTVALYSDIDAALQPIQRALRDTPTLIILDNMESLLPLPTNPPSPPATSHQPPATNHQPPITNILNLCQKLLASHPQTRLIFTSREWLPAPFDHAARGLNLGQLSQTDAMKLVEQVMTQRGWRPEASDQGNTPQAVREMVAAVGCYARALVLLAGEIATAGIPATTENVQKIMGQLEAQHPGDRENSLYASVELSLRRLPVEMQAQVKRLAVFYDGGYLANLAKVMEVEIDEAQQIAQALITVGVAEDKGRGYLQLDPALPSYWQQQLSPASLLLLRQNWANAMLQSLVFLYEQKFQDAALQAHLTTLELSNLCALLNWLPTTEKFRPELIFSVAGLIEQLLEYLDRPQALAHAVRVREVAASQFNQWGQVQFESHRLDIEQLLQQDNLSSANQAAITLLEQSLAAGESAYIDADYDIAMAHWMMGRVWNRIGQASSALPYLQTAEKKNLNSSLLWAMTERLR